MSDKVPQYLQVDELDRAIRYGYTLAYHFGENPLTTVCREYESHGRPKSLITSVCFLIRKGFKPDEKTWHCIYENRLSGMCMN